jgi:hypothetical protein
MTPSPSDETTSKRLTLARAFLRHLEPDMIDSALALLSPKASYQVLGTHEASGVFSGSASIREHLVHLYDRIGHSLDFLKWEDWLEGGASVAAIALVHAQDGSRHYSSRQLFLFQFDEANLITQFTVIFLDEGMANRFFSASDPGSRSSRPDTSG